MNRRSIRTAISLAFHQSEDRKLSHREICEKARAYLPEWATDSHVDAQISALRQGGQLEYCDGLYRIDTDDGEIDTHILNEDNEKDLDRFIMWLEGIQFITFSVDIPHLHPIALWLNCDGKLCRVSYKGGQQYSYEPVWRSMGAGTVPQRWMEEFDAHLRKLPDPNVSRLLVLELARNYRREAVA